MTRESDRRRPVRPGPVPPSLAEAAFESLLEAIAEPAYILREDGVVVAANARGRAELADGKRPLAVDRTADASTTLTWSLPTREGPHLLVVARAPTARASAVATMSARWRLTAREQEVLELVARGLPNKIIADKLAVTPRTVEAHVTSVLRKSRTESRACLLVRLWGG